jgi:hypothetical protein
VTEEEIKDICPQLERDPHFRIASPVDLGQNCFGFAAGDARRWDPAPVMSPTRAGIYWPPGVPSLNTVNAFIQAYETIGYTQCDDDQYEEGYEKVAVYISDSDEPLHAARQQEGGIWASKLGGGNDIEHGSPETIEGSRMLGRAAYYLRRPLAP